VEGLSEKTLEVSVLSATAVRTTKLPSGEAVPVLGQGTWHLAEDRHRREQEIQALRVGLDLGMTLIDTAEMYADGGAEELVGEAIEGRPERDRCTCSGRQDPLLGRQQLRRL
jgi:aryl-alcohol dehydrogenase-like predicted oxidoreductase